MLDLSEIWIGDSLKIISSGRIGSFVGLAGHRARIKVGEKIYLVPAKNLEIHEATEEEEPLDFLEDKPKPVSFHKFPRSIDLHIEKLAPEMVREQPLTILNYQLNSLKKYIEQAEMAGLKFITIIHGKGRGVLKTEVQHFLKGRKSVNLMLEVNDGGGTEVHLYG